VFNINECHFGLTDNYESCFNDGTIGILLSPPDDRGFARDDVDEDEIEGFPDWLVGRSESESFYTAPDDWTREKVKTELKNIGCIYNSKWNSDYGA